MRGRDVTSYVGIYKNQESKKTRKHAFDQESDQEKKRKKENTLSTKKKVRKQDLDHAIDQEKKKF